MNKAFSIVKETAKKAFEGKTVGRAIDVAERGVQIGETAVKAVFWLKVTAITLVVAIVVGIGAAVVSLF